MSSDPEVTPTSLPGVLIITPQVHRDERGSFVESWNERAFSSAVGTRVEFVQDNRSHSHRGVLRGLHYQVPPHAQDKLVSVVRGEVFDVAVDLRRGSALFGQHFGLELTEENGRQLWIPRGFAHGFLVLSETADVLYKVTDYYAPSAERILNWNDPDLGIQWPIDDLPIVSARDDSAPGLRQAECFDGSL